MHVSDTRLWNETCRSPGSPLGRHLPEEKSRHRPPAETRPPRTGRPTIGVVRAVDLSPQTLQELKVWREETAYSKAEDVVFTFDGKTAVTGAGIVAAFRAGLRAVGEFRKEWTTYWLRHSFVTYAREDLTADEVAQLAGHSVAIAEGTYSHPDDEIILRSSKVVREKLAQTRHSSKHAAQVEALKQTISSKPKSGKVRKKLDQR